MLLRLLVLIVLGFTTFHGYCDEDRSIFLSKPKSEWVLESENAFVLEDKYPQAPVHLLIIPKTQIRTMINASPELLGELLELAKKAATEYGGY